MVRRRLRRSADWGMVRGSGFRYSPVVTDPQRRENWHPWLGMMRGRVPVGLIGAIVFLAIWGTYFYITTR